MLGTLWHGADSLKYSLSLGGKRMLSSKRVEYYTDWWWDFLLAKLDMFHAFLGDASRSPHLIRSCGDDPVFVIILGYQLLTVIS
jgi:hypothetical protein